MRRSTVVAALLSIALAGVAVVGLALPASAHNVLISADPPNNSTLTTGPRTVTLTFNAPVQNGPNTVTAIGPDGKHWESDDHSAATVDGERVSASVRPLGPAGRYTIGYRIISADSHPVSGETHFTLTTAGTGTPNDHISVSTGSSGGIPVWVWIAAAGAALALGLFLALRPGRTTVKKSNYQEDRK